MSSLVRYPLPRAPRIARTRPSFAVGVESISIALDVATLTLTGLTSGTVTGSISVVVDTAFLDLEASAPTQIFGGSGASSKLLDVATLVLAGQDAPGTVGASVITTVATLTGDLTDFIGTGVSNVRAWLIPSIEARAVEGVVRLGGAELTLTSTFTFSLPNVPVGSYRVRAAFYQGRKQEWTSAEFALIANADLAALL